MGNITIDNFDITYISDKQSNFFASILSFFKKEIGGYVPLLTSCIISIVILFLALRFTKKEPTKTNVQKGDNKNEEETP